MGLFDKIKDLFTDEEIVETPVKKEVIKVEIASPVPIKEEKIEESISDSNILKTDEKTSPIFFNDKDFEDLNIKKEPVIPAKSSYMIKREKVKEEIKIFKPSPIISPVYGILDKNYSKEDITTKKRENPIERKNLKKVTIDDIRKKAFGTLEEDLEKELLGENNLFYKEEVIEEKDLFEELEDNLQDKFDEISINDSNSVDNIDDESNLEDEINKVLENDEKLNESELFNLIDSMYEKGEDKK